MEAAKRVWVVRGGNNNELAAQVPHKGAIDVGWASTGSIGSVGTREEIRHRMEETEPGSGTPNAVGQLFRFATEIRVGDYVLTPEKATKKVHVSRCSGMYCFDPVVFGQSYPHVLPLKYERSIERSRLSVTVRNTLGSTLTVFRADVALPFIQFVDGQKGIPPPPDDNGGATPEPGVWADEIEGQARGQILEALDDIEHHDFQIFLAGVLEALNYKARVKQKGKDGGVDILAYPDAFGLATPRIKVQAKNQKTLAGIHDVGYLHGVLGSDERGLFVCTGGFSNDAKNAPFVRNGRVALVDGMELLDLILQHYEAISARAKALLPLRMVYVPEAPVSS